MRMNDDTGNNVIRTWMGTRTKKEMKRRIMKTMKMMTLWLRMGIISDKDKDEYEYEDEDEDEDKGED